MIISKYSVYPVTAVSHCDGIKANPKLSACFLLLSKSLNVSESLGAEQSDIIHQLFVFFNITCSAGTDGITGRKAGPCQHEVSLRDGRGLFHIRQRRGVKSAWEERKSSRMLRGNEVTCRLSPTEFESGS